MLYDYYVACFLEEFWNLAAAGATFLPDVSLLDDAAQYPSCDGGSVGSAVLMNTTQKYAKILPYFTQVYTEIKWLLCVRFCTVQALCYR